MTPSPRSPGLLPPMGGVAGYGRRGVTDVTYSPVFYLYYCALASYG